VSLNKLQHLPAEMLQMQLFALNINANAFLRNTSPTFAPLATRVGISKPELASESSIPSLRECCFRVLLRKADGSDLTNLETKYGSSQEVSIWNLSEEARRVLNDCIPGSVSVGSRNKRQRLDDGYEEETGLGMGVCPSPHHEETSYFVESVEVCPSARCTFWHILTLHRSRSGILGRRGWQGSISRVKCLCNGEVALWVAWTFLTPYQVGRPQPTRATSSHSLRSPSTKGSLSAMMREGGKDPRPQTYLAALHFSIMDL